MTGVTLQEVRDAIVDAFDEYDLDEALEITLGERLANISGQGKKHPYRVLEVIRWFDYRGRETELIRNLAKLRPNHDAMQEIARKYGYAVRVTRQESGVTADGGGPVTKGFEVYVTPHLKVLPKFNVWREKMERVEGQVCFITYPCPGGTLRGTGFLVGPDAVLTNYHVMKAVIDGAVPPTAVECRFDFKILKDGTQPYRKATLLSHAKDWLIDWSPYTKAEADRTPDLQLPTADELDYALVRLNERIGEQPWAATPGKNAPPRGWIDITMAPATVPAKMAVIIAQHPNGRPLEMALDTAGVDVDRHLSLNANQTRLRYATNTEGGSSGSPCFDFDWNPVALHHYGDPDFQHRPPNYNQGVPLAKIRDRLTARGHAAALGAS